MKFSLSLWLYLNDVKDVLFFSFFIIKPLFMHLFRYYTDFKIPPKWLISKPHWFVGFLNGYASKITSQYCLNLLIDALFSFDAMKVSTPRICIWKDCTTVFFFILWNFMLDGRNSILNRLLNNGRAFTQKAILQWTNKED